MSSRDRRRGYGYGPAYGVNTGPGIVEEMMVAETIVEDLAEDDGPLQIMEDVIEAEIIGSVLDDLL